MLNEDDPESMAADDLEIQAMAVWDSQTLDQRFLL